MADRLSAYADWLVANQNKQGTPEFETVANSYKQLRSQGLANNNQDRDGAFAYGIDNMQKMIGKGIEAGGRLVGSEAIEQFGTRQVANQDRDIAQGGYQPQYAGSLRENYEKGTFLPALGEKLLETAPTGGAAIAGSGVVAAAALLGAPAWLTFGGGAAVTGGSMLMGAGESALDTEEKTGSYDPKIATSIGALVGFLDKFGAGKVIPVDKIAKMSASEVAEELTKKGFGDAAKAFTGRVSKAGLVEGATETAQDAAVMTGTAAQGGDFTGTEVQDRLTDSFVLGTSMGGGTRATLDTAGAVGNAIGPNDAPTDPDAATDFSNRLNGIIEANKLNTKDLDKTSTEGARQAVDLAHVQIASEMKQKIADLKKRLKVDRLDPAEIVADKVEAEAGTREARSKTKSIVGQQEYNATERLVGDTKEGQELLRLFRESNELTRLHNSGYVGGLSRITDQLSPFSSNVGYTARSAAELPTRLIGTAAGATLNPAIPAAQIAAVGTGRAVDALTGRRSRVAKYVRDNQGRGGVRIDPDLPSLRQQNIEQDEAQKRREAELRQLNLELDNPPAGMDPDAQQQSPEAVMFKATGLTREGVKEVLAVLEQKVPQLAPEIASYRKMLTDGTNADGLTELARAVAGEVERNPGKYSTRPGAYIPGVTPARGTAGYESPGYLQGINDNRNIINGIKMDVKTDPDLSQADKDIISSALDDMSNNLGSDPVRTANIILDNAVEQATDKLSAAAYLGPYVDRVQEQQVQATAKAEAKRPALRIYRNGILDTEGDEGPSVKRSRTFDFDATPALEAPSDVFEIGDDINVTILPIYPADGFQPDGPKAKSLNEAVQYLHDRWAKATGRTDPFEYTPENIERIAKMMAAEAERALRDDSNAIGWYDRKLKAAKSVLSLVEPRIFDSADNEAAFDLALAVTSNGAAVTDNFANAVEVFQSFLDNGVMPASTWKKGGERNESMVKAFEFYNAYQNARQNVSFQDFMDADFTVRDLQEYIKQFNEAQGTEIQLSVSENMDTVVKGSFVLGAKIGQGFYQNIRGNYDPLTMDIWWMRMWNRLVGRPFAESKPSDMQKNRDKVSGIVKEAFKNPKDYPVELMLAKQAMKQLGENRRGLYGDPQRMDDFVTMLDSKWQSYFKRYQAENGKNPVKPQLFKTTGTHTKNIKGKLQATPAGGGEREVMRQTTARAIELLAGVGYNIDTADFQALMWYPEKRLFRSLGVKGGRGEDNDYLDAAIILANKKGISDDQIQEALPDTERGNGISSGANTLGQDGSVRSGTRGTLGETNTNPSVSRQRSFDFSAPSNERLQNQVPNPVVGSRPAEPEEVRDFLPTAEALFEIGKPGSQYENGIRDIETAAKLADALGYAIHMADDRFDLERYTGEDMRDTVGALVAFDDPRSKYYLNTGKTVKGKIGVLKSSEDITPLESLFAALHEIGHGVERDFLPGKRSDSAKTINQYRTLKYRGIKYTDVVFQDTFRGVIATMMKQAGEGNQDMDAILQEIVNLQRTGILTDAQGNNAPVRDIYPEAAARKGNDLPPHLQGLLNTSGIDAFVDQTEVQYLQTPEELSADPFAVYFFDPAYAKKVMPKTTRLIRKLFNNKGGPVQFWSMPFASVIAAILANMMVAEGEEEEKQGLLSLGQGALSA